MRIQSFLATVLTLLVLPGTEAKQKSFTPTTTITFFNADTTLLQDGQHSLTAISTTTDTNSLITRTIYKDYHAKGVQLEWPTPAYTLSDDITATITVPAEPTDARLDAFTREGTLVAWDSYYVYQEDAVTVPGHKDWGHSISCNPDRCFRADWFPGGPTLSTTQHWYWRAWATYTPTPTASASAKLMPLGWVQVGAVVFSGCLGVFLVLC